MRFSSYTALGTAYADTAALLSSNAVLSWIFDSCIVLFSLAVGVDEQSLSIHTEFSSRRDKLFCETLSYPIGVYLGMMAER